MLRCSFKQQPSSSWAQRAWSWNLFRGLCGFLQPTNTTYTLVSCSPFFSSALRKWDKTYLLSRLPLHIANHLLGFPYNRINHFLRLRARLLDRRSRRSRGRGFGFGDAASGYFGAARLGGVGCGFLVGCERGLNGGDDAGLGVAWCVC
jgi:hypothetical protein